MSPRWMSSLVRARQSQEDLARQRLAAARRTADRAHDRVRSESARLDALQHQGGAEQATAFVAAIVALQAAAATHAAAVGEAQRADTWTSQRRSAATDAAVARRTAEELRERAHQDEARQVAGRVQRDLDEAAAEVHRRRTSGARP